MGKGSQEKPDLFKTMTHLIQVVCFAQLASIALSVLPDPKNVIIDSNNFEHILRWEPGAGTPMGVNYSVEWCCRKYNWSLVTCLSEKDGRECNLTKQFKNVYREYKARVKAITETQQSGWTESKWFQPVSQTNLGPPGMVVSGCGDCLLLQFTPLESLLEIYHEFDYFIDVRRAGESKIFAEMTTTFNKCQVNRLERSTNYCVRVRMSVNTNENSRFSQWHCAFTSPEEISKVPFLLVAVCVLLVLSAVVMAALVYSGYLCKPKTQLPKVLASFTLHHSSCRLQQCLVAERCPVVPVCIVYKQECKLKRRSRTLLDSSESENSDSGGEDGYEAQATRPAVYRCSSARLGEPKQAYEPDDPEQKQCLLVCDEFLVEQPQDQPDQEEKEPVIEGRYSEQQESSQDIPLFSVLLERHGDGDDDEILESPPMELALDQEDSKLLPEEHQGSPLMGSIESVNCVTGHLNIEMKDIEEQRYYSDSEEEDDTGLSGYMRR